MKFEKVLHYDVFSSEANKGNPLGIVLDADNLKEDEMQKIAKWVGFNETVFILKSKVADLRLRFFTPGHEINLCGHATIGSLYALRELHKLEDNNRIMIETNVGILPIDFDLIDSTIYVTMKQDRPKFIEFEGSVEDLAKSIGLGIDAIDRDKPIVYGNTGTWTLLVPIKDIDYFAKMKPDSSIFPRILKELPKSSVHPFCIDAYDKSCLMHARHFSSPYSGTTEDPVTGTGSGVMGAYYLKYIDKEATSASFVVEQGTEIDRDGRVKVEVQRNEDTMDVYISGTAVFVTDIFWD